MLAEINGRDGDGKPLSGYKLLKADGSTACGCWIYCGVFADGREQGRAAEAALGAELHARSSGRGRGPRTGACSTTAPPPIPRASRGRSARSSSGGTRSEKKWTGADTPDFDEEKPPDYVPPDDAKGPDAIRGDHPFIMQADGQRLDLRRRRASRTGRCRRTTSRTSRRSTTRSTRSARTRARQQNRTCAEDPYNPAAASRAPTSTRTSSRRTG